MSYYQEQTHRLMTDSMLRDWREHGGKYRLEGTKCKQCGTLFFPRRAVCGNCNSREVETYRCEHEGVIESFYRIGMPIMGMIGYGEGHPRYITNVRLNDGLVITSEIVDICDLEKLKIGAPVHMVIRKHKRQNNMAWHYAYKFVLSE